MYKASVTRLYKDQSSQHSVLLLEAIENKEKFKITVPGHKAGILALEGHGLNDRCYLYGLLSECVSRLGGALGSVVVNLDRTRGVSGAIALKQGENRVWIKADVVELVAFALHVSLPIHLDLTDEPEGDECGHEAPRRNRERAVRDHARRGQRGVRPRPGPPVGLVSGDSIGDGPWFLARFQVRIGVPRQKRRISVITGDEN